MAIDIKYNILESARRAMCTPLAAFKDDFYLAGGTGLALQIGHRVPKISIYSRVSASTTLDY